MQRNRISQSSAKSDSRSSAGVATALSTRRRGYTPPTKNEK